MLKRIIFTIGIILFFVPMAWAANVTLTVDRTSLSEEEPLSLTVHIQGAQNAPTPKILGLEAFDVQNSGSSTQVQIINGRTTASKVFQYTLYPKEKGSFEIGPAVVQIDGQELKSQTVSIRVVATTSRPVEETYYYLTATADETNPYENQQVVYTLRFFTRARIAGASLNLPEFKGFWKEDFGEQREYEKLVNGVRWNVTEIKVALFPEKPGSLTIPAASLAVDVVVQSKRRSPFDSFFDDSFFSRHQTKRVRLRSKPIEMNIQALPLQGKEKSFSGLVGSLALKTSLSKKNLAVGDSATLTVELTGDANLRDANFPAMSWSDIKAYDDQPTLNLNDRGSRLQATKVFKKALVPTKQGAVTLRPIKIQYFDPKTASYKIVSTPELALNVAPGEVKETVTHVTPPTGTDKSKREVKLLAQDIMPIKRGLSALERDMLTKNEKFTVTIIFILLPIVWTGFYFWRRHQIKIHSDAFYLKREKAYKNFLKGTKKIDGKDNLYVELSHLVRTYLGDKLEFDGQALASVDIERKLKPFHISQEVIRDFKECLKTCEAAQYGGISDASEQKDLLERVSLAAKKLEKEVRR